MGLCSRSSDCAEAELSKLQVPGGTNLSSLDWPSRSCKQLSRRRACTKGRLRQQCRSLDIWMVRHHLSATQRPCLDNRVVHLLT